MLYQGKKPSASPAPQAAPAAAAAPGTEIAKAPGTAVGQVLDFASDAGKGNEGADKDSFAIPFLVVLQPLSPQVADKSVEGAEAGHMMNSVTLELFETLVVIPCAFARRWVRWAPRDAGGGFKGEHTTAEAQDMRTRGLVKELEGRLYFPLEGGAVDPKKCDLLADTRNHYVILLRSETEDFGTPAILALTSTGIKRSKNFLSRIEGIKLRRADGSLFTPPSFSHMYRIKTVREENAKGKWYSPEISLIGPIKNEEIYKSARAFYEQVQSGRVNAAHESVKQTGGPGAEEEDGKHF